MVLRRARRRALPEPGCRPRLHAAARAGQPAFGRLLGRPQARPIRPIGDPRCIASGQRDLGRFVDRGSRWCMPGEESLLRTWCGPSHRRQPGTPAVARWKPPGAASRPIRRDRAGSALNSNDHPSEATEVPRRSTVGFHLREHAPRRSSLPAKGLCAICLKPETAQDPKISAQGSARQAEPVPTGSRF